MSSAGCNISISSASHFKFLQFRQAEKIAVFNAVHKHFKIKKGFSYHVFVSFLLSINSMFIKYAKTRFVHLLCLTIVLARLVQGENLK